MVNSSFWYCKKTLIFERLFINLKTLNIFDLNKG